MNRMPIVGFDRFVDGDGAMRWKLFGILPIVTTAGLDIARSAVGRIMVESE